MCTINYHGRMRNGYCQAHIAIENCKLVEITFCCPNKKLQIRYLFFEISCSVDSIVYLLCIWVTRLNHNTEVDLWRSELLFPLYLYVSKSVHQWVAR